MLEWSKVSLHVKLFLIEKQFGQIDVSKIKTDITSLSNRTGKSDEVFKFVVSWYM